MTLSSEWQKHLKPLQGEGKSNSEDPGGSSTPKDAPSGQSDQATSGYTKTVSPTEAPWLPLMVYRAQYNITVRPVTPELCLAEGADGGFTGHSVGDESRSLVEEYWHQRLIGESGNASLLTLEPRDGADGATSVCLEGQSPPLSAGHGMAISISNWHGEAVPQCTAMWSKYYAHYQRTPENTELAEWVAKRYTRRRREINLVGSGGGTISSEDDPQT